MQTLTIDLILEPRDDGGPDRTNEHPDRTATVTLRDDGTATVRLRAVMVAGKDVTGDVGFDKNQKVVRNNVEDSFVHVPLKAHVLRAAEGVARRALNQAVVKEVVRIMDAHKK